MKYTIKTKLDNITQLKNGTFSYDEKIISIQHQIKNYPTPISDCDEQFDFLLTERDRLLNDTKWDVADYYKWKNKFLDPDFGPDQLKDSPLESKEEKDHRNDWKGLV